eukprot:969956-Ditylum_brightwellii.AAC.1
MVEIMKEKNCERHGLMEGGILPHPSTCEVLAAMAGIVFNSSYQEGGSTMDMVEDHFNETCADGATYFVTYQCV